MLTTTPRGSTSAARAVFHVLSPPLVHEYAASRGEGIRPLSEPRVRTRLFGAPAGVERATRPGRTARVSWSVQLMLVWTMASISAGSVSANATGISWLAPTLLTSTPTSTVRAASATRRTAACMPPASDASAMTDIVRTLYLDSSSRASSSSALWRRPTRMIPKPAAASWRANSSPMPPVQPVTMAHVMPLALLNFLSWCLACFPAGLSRSHHAPHSRSCPT